VAERSRRVRAGGRERSRRLCAAAFALALAAAGRASALTIQEIRRGFYAAVDDAAARSALETAIHAAWPRLPETPVADRAYAAALRGLEGRQSPSLLDKIRFVREGIALFEGLVESAPLDLETRFLRYSFYSELPSVFGVSGLVSVDRSALIEQLSRRDYSVVPALMQRDMIRRMIGGIPMGDVDKNRLKNLL
jgi:hypothetical protein